MNLRLKLLLASASFAVVAAATCWLAGLDVPHGAEREYARSPEKLVPEATASAPSADSLRDVRPGATRAGSKENALGDAPTPAKPVPSKAVVTSSVSVAVTPSLTAPAVDAPLRGRRSPREIYTDPASTRSKLSAPSASGTISTRVSPDHPPAVSPAPVIPIFVPPTPSADNVVSARSKEPAQSSAAPSRRLDPSLESTPETAESPRVLASSNRPSSPPAFSANTDLAAPASEPTPSPRLGRAVLSTEMQRLRAQLGWQAFDQWARARAENGEE